jgi:hypothetical protein
MTIGAFRLNGVGKVLGDTGDVFSAETSSSNIMEPNGSSNFLSGPQCIECVGFTNDSTPRPVIAAVTGFITSNVGGINQKGGANIVLLKNVLTCDSSGITNIYNGQSSYEIDGGALSSVRPVITGKFNGSESRNTNTSGTSTQEFQVAYTKATNDGQGNYTYQVKVKNIQVQGTTDDAVSSNTSTIGTLDSQTFPTDGAILDMALTTNTTGKTSLLYRSDTSDNHRQDILSGSFSTTAAPTETNSLSSSTPYSHQGNVRMIGLPDGGCDYRGAMMAGGSDPTAHFFSYNGTTRTTSAAATISKTFTGDGSTLDGLVNSIPLLCSVAANKIVYGVYSPDDNKIYLKCATHTFGGSCATGTTTSGSEFVIDEGYDNAAIVGGFEDNRFYVVAEKNSQGIADGNHTSTLQGTYISTFITDGNTIEQVGGIQKTTITGGVIRPQAFCATKFSHQDIGEYIVAGGADKNSISQTTENGFFRIQYYKKLT